MERKVRCVNRSDYPRQDLCRLDLAATVDRCFSDDVVGSITALFWTSTKTFAAVVLAAAMASDSGALPIVVLTAFVVAPALKLLSLLALDAAGSSATDLSAIDTASAHPFPIGAGARSVWGGCRYGIAARQRRDWCFQSNILIERAGNFAILPGNVTAVRRIIAVRDPVEFVEVIIRRCAARESFGDPVLVPTIQEVGVEAVTSRIAVSEHQCLGIDDGCDALCEVEEYFHPEGWNSNAVGVGAPKDPFRVGHVGAGCVDAIRKPNLGHQASSILPTTFVGDIWKRTVHTIDSLCPCIACPGVYAPLVLVWSRCTQVRPAGYGVEITVREVQRYVFVIWWAGISIVDLLARLMDINKPTSVTSLRIQGRCPVRATVVGRAGICGVV